MGSSLSTPAIVDLALGAAARLRARGGTVSFDPNLRKEVLATPGTRETMERVLALTDLFLPSGPELFLFTRATDEPAAAAELLARGIRAVVVKKGADGAAFHDAAGSTSLAAFAAEEVDPTGAGDTFAGTFVTAWLRRLAPTEALRLANAAGALAVGRRGPMEGTSTEAELAAFLAVPPMTRLLAGLPARHARGEPAGIASVCSAHPLVIEAALRLGTAGRRPGADRGDLQPGEPGGRLHRDDPGRLPRFRRDDRRTRRLPARRARSSAATISARTRGNTSPPPTPSPAPAPWSRPTSAPAFPRSTSTPAWAAPASPPPCRTPSPPNAPPTSPRRPRPPPTAPNRRSTSSAPRSRSPAAPPKPSTTSPITAPEAALETVEVHRRAFAARDLAAAFDRAIAVVVQPGVEFGNESVAVYRPEAAQALAAARRGIPQVVFEAHSTDYQPPEALAALVRDGFAILKVGPGLTFALREALYGLDQIAAALDGRPPELQEAMERLMLANPAHWQKYYHGDPADPPPASATSATPTASATTGPRPRPAPPSAACSPASKAAASRKPWSASTSAPSTPMSPPAGSRPEPQSLLIAAVQRVLGQYRDAVTPG